MQKKTRCVRWQHSITANRGAVRLRAACLGSAAIALKCALRLTGARRWRLAWLRHNGNNKKASLSATCRPSPRLLIVTWWMCLLSICLRLECCLIYFFFSLSLFLVAEDEPDQLMERRVRSPAEPTQALQGETRKSNQFSFFLFLFSKL